MQKELESNSGPLSRSYGLEMIGFPILYWGVLHDESSLHSKSTPIKKGLFIPLWDMLWMFAWNKHFHPLSLFTSDTVAFARISIMCVSMCVRVCICACLVAHCGVRICFRPADSHFICTFAQVCVCVWTCWHVRVHSHVTQCLLCSPALFVPVASCL